MDNPIQLRNALFAIRGVLAFVAFTEVRKTIELCIIHSYNFIVALQCKNSYQCVCILYKLLAGFNFSPLPFAFWNRWTRARSRLRQGQSVQPASPAPRLTICPGHWANILSCFWPLLFAKWTNTLSPRRYYYASTYAHQLNILIFIFNFNKWSPSLMILPILILILRSGINNDFM